MKTVIRNVDDMDASDRQALERLLGQSLHETQQLVIGIVNRQAPFSDGPPAATRQAVGTPALPEWCNVYEGLSDAQIAELEQTILQRADMSRPCE